MTPAIDLVRAARGVLLDFDGPICSVFAGWPASAVAARLRGDIAAQGIDVHPVGSETDPLAILLWIGENYPELVEFVDTRLCVAEESAVRTAKPTDYSDEIIRHSARTGRSVAIVSNNSAVAIRSYLELRDLLRHVEIISGREFARPELMKPNPHSLIVAADALRVTLQDCLLIGDSVTDVLAAKSVSVRSIGYANRTDKFAKLAEAGADAVVSTLEPLARAVAVD
ncbi:HAD family hydrolase [Kutzneria chonburiensis]|uniref:HAD family hydrolase n=1 Tax=Kutzneria chonburiensis TaxID=1483604 RepID=A0ABV6MIC4_9PSEU|nr:HAD family hydrolase [Kutzneria chonburiensis]